MKKITAVPPGGSITHPPKEMYARIRAAARRAWWTRDAWEDVAQEAWILAHTRGYYDSRMLREAARNLGIWRGGESLEALLEAGRDFPARGVNNNAEPLRRRLGGAIRLLAPKLRLAAQLVLGGYTMREAAAAAKVSEATLSIGLAALGTQLTGKSRKKGSLQDSAMPLFSPGVREATK